jgi:hypothetical protein
LFSAVVTAFTIESYQWLEEDPADKTVALLTTISKHLSQPPDAAYSRVLVESAPETFRASSLAVWVNALWFCSLTLALMAALFGILVQQWLREYERVLPRVATPKRRACLRQFRFNGLHGWGVPGIISGLSLMLQVALAVFLAGLVVMLWNLSKVVASLLTGVVGLAFVVLIAAIVIPAFSKECPYRSPLAWAVYSVAQHSLDILLSSKTHFATWVDRDIQGQGPAAPPAVLWLKHMMPQDQIPQLDSLEPNSSNNPQDDFLKCIVFRALGPRANYPKHRNDVSTNLLRWIESIKRSSTQSVGLLWELELLAAMQNVARKGPAEGSKAVTLIDMLYLTDSDNTTTRHMFFSRVLGTFFLLQPSTSDIRRLAKHVLECTQGLLAGMYRDHCMLYHPMDVVKY